MADEMVNEIQAPDPQLSLIQTEIKAIEEMESKLREGNDQFKGHFVNNATFREHDEQIKNFQKNRNSVRKEILKQPEVASLEQELKALRFDLGERRKTLSALLTDYKDRTGSTQLPLLDGMVGDILLSAKVIKSKRK